MSEQVKDFVYSVAAEDAVESKAHFDSIMKDKVIDALKNKQIEVAKNMFNQSSDQE